MKKYIFIFLISSISMLNAQEIERQVIPIGGNAIQTSDIYLSWTMGETVVGTITSPRYSLSQGFQQGNVEEMTTSVFLDFEKMEGMIYPNPCVRYLILEVPDILPKGSLELSVVSANGRLIERRLISDMESTRISLDVDELPGGTYWLVLTDKEALKQGVWAFQKIDNN